MSFAPGNYRNLLAVIANVAEKCSRSPEDIRLLTVSKTIPAEVLKELYDECGVRHFGENREPELAMKYDVLPKDIIWHFIGPLQSNKVRKVVKLAKVIHSVSSTALVERVDRISGEEALSPEFFLEVNVSGEASKGGLRGDELFDAAAAAARCRHARCTGLMTMAPLNADDDTLNDIFGKLKELRDECETRFQLKLPQLSMGMSGDFPIAIARGATIVRIGSRIFDGVERISK